MSNTSIELKWKQRFLGLAREVSTWSKDPSKQIGAVIISEEFRVLATGYNGFPKGIEDNETRLTDRETKYKYIVHAEMNAIFNATHSGTSLKDSILFVWGLPVCSECAKGVIQSGVKHIVMPNGNVPQRWLDSFELSSKLFDESGLTYEFIDIY